MRNKGQIMCIGIYAVVVTFKNTIHFIYYEIHLKYFQDTDVPIHRQFTSAMENNIAGKR